MTSLSTRTTVLGVTNAKGMYDPRQTLAANTSLSGPLLSRFDIILVLRDVQNAQWDEHVSSHILDGHAEGAASVGTAEAAACGAGTPSTRTRHAAQDQVWLCPCRPCMHHSRLETWLALGHAREVPGAALALHACLAAEESAGGRRCKEALLALEPSQAPAQAWSMERLRAYIAWVKAAFAPVMSAGAEAVLLGYWRLVRAGMDRQAERSTVRMLESLVRLAQARDPPACAP